MDSDVTGRAARVLKSNGRSAAIYVGPLAALVGVRALAAWSAHDVGGLWFYSSLAALLAALGILMIARPTTLTLDNSGFTWQGLWGGLRVKWVDVAQLGIAAPRGLARAAPGRPGSDGIGFSYIKGREPHRQRWAGRMNESAFGYQRRIPNLWDMPSEELLRLMQDYRAAATGSEAPDERFLSSVEA